MHVRHVQKVPYSALGSETVCPVSRFSWFSSSLLAKCNIKVFPLQARCGAEGG